MKKLLVAALAAGAALTTIPAADAAQGCGRGFHRDYYGHCRPNRARPVIVTPGGLVIGNFYRGRGYWDGRRYYRHRYWRHSGWRYR